ncbi:MAG: M23 family metallopeptidase [Desulfovibrio sp.]|nr:MAG: M23 family metallopeptidase [Desulfovibrio sp.]
MPRSTAKSRSRFLPTALIILLVAGITGLAFWYFLLADRTEPELRLSPQAIVVSKHTRFSVEAQDADSTLSRITVTAIMHGDPYPLLDQTLAPGQQTAELSFTLEELLFDSGEVVIEVTATDSSVANFGEGNTATLSRSLNLDTEPPQLFIQSLEHNLSQGGSGAVSFQASEEIVNAGVVLQDSDIFFPAFEQDNGNYVCLFTLPYFMAPEDFKPLVVAQDSAGNPAQTSFHYTTKATEYRQRTINVPDSFLERIAPEFPEYFENAPSLVEGYIRVNNELRADNQEALYSIAEDTTTAPQWSGRFLRMAGETTAFFGDQRTYLYNDEVIDFQVHLGYDLASVRHDNVPAANNGTVVYAQELGIYGRSVVIDHGMSLQTIYSHLSGINVSVGDFVEQGQTIGQTGITGLAGGDHLHFGVLIGGIAVTPKEWWDGEWVALNIANRLLQPE